MKKIVKIAGKLLKYSLLLVFILIGGFFLINAFDEELNPEAKKFFAVQERPTENDVYYFLAGFNAPSGTEDIVKFGKSLTTYYVGADALEYVAIDNDGIRCWGSEETAKDLLHCPDEEIVKKELEKNSELFERYYQIYQYSGYIPPVSAEDSYMASGGDIVWIHQRIAADIVIKLRHGKFEEAFDQWHKNVSFWHRTFEQGRFTFVEASIFMVVHGINQKMLPIILKADPSIAKKYKDKIDQVLHPIGVNTWNISSILKEDYRYLEYIFKEAEGGKLDYFIYDISEDSIYNNFTWLFPYFLQENATRNLYYDFVSTLIELSKLPPKEFALKIDGEMAKFKKYDSYYEKRHKKLLWNLIYNPLGKQLFSSFAYGANLINAMHVHEAKANIIKLYVEILVNDIPDDKITEFIKNAPPEMKNSLNGKPFLWDKEEKRIYFQMYPEIPDFFYNIYL